MQLLLRAPEKFRQNDSSYLFQAFLEECEQACRGVHDKDLRQLRPVKFLVSMMVLMITMFVGEMILSRLKLSLSGILNLDFEAEEDPVAGNLEVW